MIIISCDNEKNEKEDIKPDNILFGNLSSPLAASTVRVWDVEDHRICRVDIPLPSDSSATIMLDVDNNNISDFKIVLSHNYWEPTQDCGHCSLYEYDIKIQGVNGSDSIAAAVDKPLGARYFKDSYIISFDHSWTKQAILIMSGGCNRPTFTIESQYIGFKHNNQVGWIKLAPSSNNGLSIENYAINLTDYKTIKAGQIK